MSYNPSTLRELGAFWTAHEGVNLGVVGDGRHAKGYHLGEDRIYDGSGPGLGSRDYSVQTPRDKAGLSEAASAIDLGKLNGRLTDLRKFSTWLVKRCRANAPATRDVREVIYSPDGKRVLRWDRERGYASAPREGEADISHITHTHISFYRDSESRSKVPIFAPYFAPAMPDTATEAAVKFDPKGSPVVGVATTTRDTLLIRWDGERVPIEANTPRNVYAVVTLGDGRKAYLVTMGEQAHYLVADQRATYAPRDLGDRTTPVELRVGGSVVYDKEV